MPSSKPIQGVNDLLTRSPEIAKEWHPTKNGDLTPNDVTYGSKKKVWWQCPKYEHHFYDAVIHTRTLSRCGCPFCSGNRVSPENSLATKFPDIAREWHPTKNGDLTPHDISHGSSQKVWWQCSQYSHHAWDAVVGSRTNLKAGCPYCSGNQVSSENCLATKFPEIAKEWHPTKNGDLTPNDVTYGSTTRVWWQCSKYSHHEWDTQVNSRTNAQTSCPYCAGLKVSPENCLATKFPEIAKEWHPTKNGDLTPNDVTYGSMTRVWWQCSRFLEHFWDTNVGDRTNYKTGCPFCTKQTSRPELRILAEFRYLFNQVISRKKLSTFEVDVYLPELKIAIEYDGSYFHLDKEKQDYKKNKILNKLGITLIRVREKPLIKLSNSDVLVSDHVLRKSDINLIIQIIIDQKKIKNSLLSETLRCYLNHDDFQNDIQFYEYVSALPGPQKEHSLAFQDPLTAKEWHPKKNGNLSPKDVTKGSSFKVWWQCSKNIEHEWRAVINDRTGKKSTCPYCSGKLASPGYSLEDLYPQIAKQWHPTRNGDHKPSDVTPKSGKKFWWQCTKNQDHVWDAPVVERTDREYGCPFCSGKRVSQDNCLATKFPQISKQWHPTKNGILTSNDVTHASDKKIWWRCLKFPHHEWEATVNSRTRTIKEGKKTKLSSCPYCSGRKLCRENSLSTKYPEVARQWHPSKNYPLQPDQVTFSSNQKVWWQCCKYPHHEWEVSVNSRTNKQGKEKLDINCPFCLGNRVSPENCLATKFPEIAKEWHPIKNGDLTPYSFTHGSKVKVWWQCRKYPHHEWDAKINGRTSGQGCPECGAKARRLKSANSLQDKFPEIAKEWHPTKNGIDTPNDFSYGSGKKIWWQCHLIKDHIWEATIKARTQGSRCPYCFGKRKNTST